MSYRPITDVWILARPKVKYYGAYPNGFLERARALLGVTPLDPVLHVCGGMARQYPAKPRGFGPLDKTLDLDAKLSPDYIQAATDPLPWMRRQDEPWPALIADPPYTEDDAAHYDANQLSGAERAEIAAKILEPLHNLKPGTPEHAEAAALAMEQLEEAAKAVKDFPAANRILRNMLDRVRPGGRVGMLHYILPQPPREGVRFVACVGVIVGYNNRMRVFSVFEKEMPEVAPSVDAVGRPDGSSEGRPRAHSAFGSPEQTEEQR